MAISQAKAFGFDTVSCSSTGNLANAVAAHAAREGLKAWIFIPSDLEPAKILGTNVFGAKVVRIAGNYDQVNRLCSQIADEHRWGFVNVNLRPYYAEGSKTVGFEIAEQLGWRLPDNVVCPMAGGSLIIKIKKAFDELVKLGLVEGKEVKFFGAQATGCSPISTAVKTGSSEIEPQKPTTIARSLAIGNPADGHYAIKTIKGSGGWSEDVSDPEVIDSINLLAETEGVFTETAGGVTVGTAGKLYRQDRILPEETTVLCITGNGLKTTDVLAGVYQTERPIAPKLTEFEAYLQQTLSPSEIPGVIAEAEAARVGAAKSCRSPFKFRPHCAATLTALVRSPAPHRTLPNCSRCSMRSFPDLKPHLRDDKGQVRRFLNIYVNEEDIRFLGGQTYAFQEGDEVLLVPSIAGGSM